MSGYREHIGKLNAELYPREELTERVVRAKQYMDGHYGEDIDLKAVCDVAYVSRYHFIRVFKAHYGRTPHQYLQEVRIRKAKELIQAGMTVQRACFSVGYQSVPSFSALFKKLTGSPPSRLKQESNFR